MAKLQQMRLQVMTVFALAQSESRLHDAAEIVFPNHL
jgi:hypothetical protein